MAQACIFLATGYEEVEMLTVVDMLRRAKISIDMVSITDQKEVTSSHNITITADKTLSEVNFEAAEMLILPTVLGERGILEGKKATCYPSFADKLATGDYVKQPVVTDDNVITSRGMGTCIEFAGAIIAALKDKATADAVKEAIIYNDVY